MESMAGLNLSARCLAEGTWELQRTPGDLPDLCLSRGFGAVCANIRRLNQRGQTMLQHWPRKAASQLWVNRSCCVCVWPKFIDFWSGSDPRRAGDVPVTHR